jgi:hypothetical protein
MTDDEPTQTDHAVATDGSRTTAPQGAYSRTELAVGVLIAALGIGIAVVLPAVVGL